VPMRTHWARPFVGTIGLAGVDIFFVISGFIIYHVAMRSAAQVDVVGRGRAVYEFAMKRIVRIYPLYWVVFAAAAIIMIWVPLPASFPKKPQLDLLLLIDSIPNYRVGAAWTLTFEVYFYAVTTLSILFFPKKIFTGLLIWFAAIVAATLLSTVFGTAIPLDYVFAPVLLEFLLGIVVGMLVDRGERRLALPAICIGAAWLLLGTHLLFRNDGKEAGSYLLRLVCWGLPAALIVYGVVALEMRKAWIMPRLLQYLGNASFSLYLWHAVVFVGVAALFEHLGWVGTVDRSLLTLLMAAIGLGVGLLSYHLLERPSLRVLGKALVGKRIQSATTHPIRAS
jgi:exopolysaccharide production protein ExoZ